MSVALHEAGGLDTKLRYAQALAEGGLLPKAFQKQPANVLLAIEYGEALGIPPMVAINEINVINGTPSLSASLMASLARKAGHKVRVYGDDKSATCEIVRSDDPDYTHKAVWDEAKARKSSLWGKGHWGKDPATMLKWRAISECVRFACSEVLGGLKYTDDEVRDFTGPQVTVQQVQEPHTPPQVVSIADAVAERQQQGSGITAKQSARLGHLIRELGLAKDEYLTFVRGVIGRHVAGTVELSSSEADRVIAALTADPAPDEAVDEDTGEIVQAELVES